MRIYALVEGKTESRFVSAVLSPHFALRGKSLAPVQLSTSRDHRGGMTSFDRVKRGLWALMRQHRGLDVAFTTMFDLYALPTDFPGFDPLLRDSHEKTRRIEAAMGAAFDDRRLIPYIQVHEFEALLFVDLSVLPPLFVDEDYRHAIESLRTSVGADADPERINDSLETSPRHRLIQFSQAAKNERPRLGRTRLKRLDWSGCEIAARISRNGLASWRRWFPGPLKYIRRRRPDLFSQRHHQFQERINFALRMEVITRPAVPSASDAHRDRSAANREGVFIIPVVPDV